MERKLDKSKTMNTWGAMNIKTQIHLEGETENNDEIKISGIDVGG